MGKWRRTFLMMMPLILVGACKPRRDQSQVLGAEMAGPPPAGETTSNEQLTPKLVWAVKNFVQSMETRYPTTSTAGWLYYNHVFGDADKDYAVSNPDKLQFGNAGLKNHFKKLWEASPEFSADIDTFFQRINAIDEEKDTAIPAPMLTTSRFRRPVIEYVSDVDFYAEALKISHGNVFRAVSLLGTTGHDDMENTWKGEELLASSKLFATGALGPQAMVAADTRNSFMFVGRAVEEMWGTGNRSAGGPSLINDNFLEFSTRLTKELTGERAPAYGYQMIGGFYMGCQLAKAAMGPVRLDPFVVLALVKGSDYNFPGAHDSLEGFVANKSLIPSLKALTDAFSGSNSMRQRFGSFVSALWPSNLYKKYDFDLAADLPSIGGYLYKILTLPKWFTGVPEIKTLYDLGYYEPYTKGIQPPKDWSPERFEVAKRILDFRLMHVRYVMEQHRVGAAYGAKVCREYQAGLSDQIGLTDPTERALFAMGIMHPNQSFEQVLAREDLAARLGDLAKDKTRLRAAFDRLTETLQAPEVLAKLDYGPMPFRKGRLLP